MYQFSPEMRRAYESMSLPFVYYQLLDGKVVPILLSDGFCNQIESDRETLMKTLCSGMFEGMHPDDAGRVARISMAFAHHESEYDVFFRFRHRDGYHVIHAVGHWQIMPDGTELAVLTYSDHTQSRESQGLLAEQYHSFQKDKFYRDPLTGLPNTNYMREFAVERINRLRGEGKTPVLIYSDVDSMQYYNNQYGYVEGDKLLCIIAEAFAKHFPDALVSRGADDHFILVDTWVSEEDIEARIHQANREIQQKAAGKTHGFQAGISLFDLDTTFPVALDHARSALKRIGSDLNKSYRIYSQSADEHYWKERYIVQSLDKALEEGWIKAFYQGIGRMETKRTACFEALARWIDPNRGTISPEEFIPVLEKYHLLYKLDLYMFEQVCREVPVRRKAGFPLKPVSINFAAQDFDYRNIPEELDMLYEKYEMGQYVPKDYFIVEITEQDMATATGEFHDQLRDLRKRGYRLWLDDFGSGYSSLNVFSRFDVDLIKFDMALIRDLDSRNGLNRKIIRAMTEIAVGQGIHTLAEGIETQEQWDFLRDVGVELGQGFLYRRPESLNTLLFKLENGVLRPACETESERHYYMNQMRIPENGIRGNGNQAEA